jgi:hypothetical protein
MIMIMEYKLERLLDKIGISLHQGSPAFVLDSETLQNMLMIYGRYFESAVRAVTRL